MTRTALTVAALALGATLLSSSAWAAGSCGGNFATQVDCTIDSATDVGPSNVNAPRSTGETLTGTGVYTFTVNNPTTTWDISNAPNFPPVTVNGNNPLTSGQYTEAGGVRLPWASLVASVGSTYFPIATGGAVISNLSGALSLMVWDNDTLNNVGTQSVTIRQSTDPNLLAGVNVFARENSLTATGQGFVDTELTLTSGNSYVIRPTDLLQTYGLGNTANRVSTADGLPAFGLCSNVLCPPQDGNVVVGPGFEFGELVALVGDANCANGTYYRVGTGTTLTGVDGHLCLLIWDSDASDNYGFINVQISLAEVPEPASLMLLGGGLAALLLARRRRSRA